MTRTPANRIDRVQHAATLAAGERARVLARQGRDVIDLGQSSPHHVTLAHIVDAGIKALREGLTNISSSRGLPEFRQALANKLAAHNGLAIDPEGDVLVTPGSKQGLYYAINSYIGPGDEVLLPEPTWVSFRQQVELAQGVPVPVVLSEEEEYHLSYQSLQQQVTPRTKALVVNNPNNPTGRVYCQDELQAVADVATENDLLVVCDETYEYFTYGFHRHLTLASLPGMWERTLTSYTFTKAYAMSGWRLGCIVGPASLLEPLARIHRKTTLETVLEEARGCSSESGIMVLEQKTAWKRGAPNRCCHRTIPTGSASSLMTTAWWPMPACSCRPPSPSTWA